ncbi:MAG: hypothetical protein ABSG62_10775 [Terracidiphilus sp.]|jgi:hypothetical protein
MVKEPESPCDFAKLRYFSAPRWLNLWKILLYAFGAAVVLFLVAAILLFIRSTWLAGAITALGTIVSGTGIAWVVKLETTAAADEKRRLRPAQTGVRAARCGSHRDGTTALAGQIACGSPEFAWVARQVDSMNRRQSEGG